MTAMLLSVPLMAQADPTSGILYYTRFDHGAGESNVKSINYSYDGLVTYALTGKTGIATTNGADGIIFAPDGDLLVGGQSNGIVSKVKISNGSITTASPGVGDAYHLSLAPDGSKAYATNIPGSLGFVNLGPFSGGSQITLTGDDTAITSLAFDQSGNAYYTTANSGGTSGNVGRINLTTGVTTQVRAGIAGAHGMVYDSYTNTLDLFGGTHIRQLNLDAGLTDYSDFDVSTALTGSQNAAFQFDQGAADGKGHVFVADNNNGDLLFVDYHTSLHFADGSNFRANLFLDNQLDDVAPLSGLGSSAPTPEPGSLALFGGLSLSGLGVLLRRRSIRKSA